MVEKKTAPKSKHKAPAKKSAGKKQTARAKGSVAGGSAKNATTSAGAGKQLFVTRVSVKHVRVSPRKARLVVNMIKGMQVDPALQTLQFSPKKTSAFCEKLLRSAIVNAKERGGVDIDELWVLGAFVDQGRTLKRFMPAAHGRAVPNYKRSSHITLVVGQRGARITG
ncbi:MAG: 50S ribosomal protein L22 [Oligoflexia bacterium]|nr:50S ribosomal protein L22 [Oligoflexia bacterium]